MHSVYGLEMLQIPLIFVSIFRQPDKLITITTCNFVWLALVRWRWLVVLLSFQQYTIVYIEICLFLWHLWLAVSSFVSWSLTCWYTTLVHCLSSASLSSGNLVINFLSTEICLLQRGQQRLQVLVS